MEEKKEIKMISIPTEQYEELQADAGWTEHYFQKNIGLQKELAKEREGARGLVKEINETISLLDRVLKDQQQIKKMEKTLNDVDPDYAEELMVQIHDDLVGALAKHKERET